MHAMPARIAIAASAVIISYTVTRPAVADDLVYSQPALATSGDSFPSEINGSQRADDWVANTASTVTSIRWWGTTAGSGGTGNFTLRVFSDAGGLPGALVDQFDIGTAFTKTDTGFTDFNGRDIFKYEATLPDDGFVPTQTAIYWFNIMNNQAVAGGPMWLWHQGGSGNNAHTFRIGAASWNSAGGDLSLELFVSAPPPPDCPGDLDGNNTVDVDDLLEVINAWGACPGCPADITGNGEVDVDDLLAVINVWGDCT